MVNIFCLLEFVEEMPRKSNLRSNPRPNRSAKLYCKQLKLQRQTHKPDQG